MHICMDVLQKKQGVIYNLCMLYRKSQPGCEEIDNNPGYRCIKYVYVPRHIRIQRNPDPQLAAHAEDVELGRVE